MESPTETEAHWQREPRDGAGPAPAPAASESARKAGVSRDKGQISVLLFFLQIFEIFFKSHNGKQAEGRALGSQKKQNPLFRLPGKTG